MIEIKEELLTEDQKRDLFDKMLWSCDVPPVPTTNWSDDDWITWIDRCGAWWVENKSCERAEKT